LDCAAFGCIHEFRRELTLPKGCCIERRGKETWPFPTNRSYWPCTEHQSDSEASNDIQSTVKFLWESGYFIYGLNPLLWSRVEDSYSVSQVILLPSPLSDCLDAKGFSMIIMTDFYRCRVPRYLREILKRGRFEFYRDIKAFATPHLPQICGGTTLD
jgi:hypothetical protein